MKTWTAIVECGGTDIEEFDIQAPTKADAWKIAQREAAEMYGDGVIIDLHERLPGMS